MQSAVRRPRNYWDTLKRQRNFFTLLAKDLKIDASKPDDWYTIAIDLPDEIKRRGGDFVSREYNGKPFDALITLFPELKFHTLHPVLKAKQPNGTPPFSIPYFRILELYPKLQRFLELVWKRCSASQNQQ